MTKTSEAAAKFIKKFLADNPKVQVVTVVPNKPRTRRATPEAAKTFVKQYLSQRREK
jgi:cell division protein FtsI/penicillin-binding protein 2